MRPTTQTVTLTKVRAQFARLAWAKPGPIQLWDLGPGFRRDDGIWGVGFLDRWS